MRFSDWEPVYEAVLADFGYDRGADERARDILADLLPGPGYDPARLDIQGATVAVAGGADRLTQTGDLALAREADAVVAASDAATRLREHGVRVDCMVTDIDKRPETARELTEAGTPVAVHAHGDNVETLRSVVPGLEGGAVMPTTQARPVDGVYNFGGFTDGDRAAFLADTLGAVASFFRGGISTTPRSMRRRDGKLGWAEQLLYWLERRRDERFGLLDGRRESVTPPETVG